MGLLEGKKILITGANRGIGRQIALACAAEGADIALVGRKLESLEAAASQVRSAGAKAFTLAWDVRDVSRADDLMESAWAQMGGLDVVFNNAGVYDTTPFLEISEEIWDRLLDTNLKAVYFSCQAAARAMLARGARGKIINISSEAGVLPAAVPYGVSKWGVIAMTRGLGQLLFPKGIVVTSIAPGPVTTDMSGWSETGNEQIDTPFGRMAHPEEVSDLAVFLASDKSARIAGETILINGGL